MAQCTANSKTSGIRCKQPAIPGGTVCRYHGGSAPQVRNAAAARLAAAVDPAVTHLINAIDNKDHPGVALRAAQDILDRNNMKGENIIRLMMPEGGALPVKLSDDQVSRIRSLSPAEAAILDRVLGFIETGERKPDPGPEPAQ